MPLADFPLVASKIQRDFSREKVRVPLADFPLVVLKIQRVFSRDKVRVTLVDFPLVFLKIQRVFSREKSPSDTGGFCRNRFEHRRFRENRGFVGRPKNLSGHSLPTLAALGFS